MAGRFLATLALAQGAAALIDKHFDFVDVVVNLDVVVSPQIANSVARLVAAAEDDDDGLRACATVDAAMSTCESAGAFDVTAAPSDATNCLCCRSSTGLAPAYSACARYIATAYGDEVVFSEISTLWAACAAAGDGACTRTQPPVPTRTEVNPPFGHVTMPAGCTSMLDIYYSCYDELQGFVTVRMADAADCFCHDRSGDYDTAFQDYASSCLPYARTSARADYALISQFQDICEDYIGATTDRLSFSIVSTLTDALGLPTITRPSSTSSPTEEPTPRDGADGGEDEPPQTSNPAAGGAVPEFVAWVANLATLVLSFLTLI